MAHGSISKSIAIIGGGPSGVACALFLKQKGLHVTLFDKNELLKTIIPTGGGKCNMAHAIYDFRELASNYPRGEKFLYSVFSKFGTADTLNFFKSIGIETYTREDGCIFPLSNSSKAVREKLLKSLDCGFVKEEVLSIERGFKIRTNKSSYYFDIVVAAAGGHSGYEFLKPLDINIISPVQSLVGLVSAEDFSSLAGVSINNILFTHKGVSGPEIYKISSLRARDKMPYTLSFNLTGEFDIQDYLNKNPHKCIKNLISEFIPKSLAVYILGKAGIPDDTKCHMINGKMRDKVYKMLTDYKITVTGKVPDGEIVTCGGVDLKEVNPKTLESKKHDGLFFCGEILDIDGFCGGFNLQNCWSTAFAAAENIAEVCSCS